MWVMANSDYVNTRTNKRIITEGKQYKVMRKHSKTNEYTLRNDNNKICVVPQEIFAVVG